ncbi:MAG: type IV pilus biogenesis/stability protein PilW [Halopseudomonas yangmingensis]|uniref:Type IV pilus assembly protein PilF n=1 Tax=Halopseudomonas yangmingensis TaxID=1720063 RepID=A0A1I4R892_9GAMM|nr:type IV pilus biogenesis/stability protein PilW [Halopseudomonas yangmingensis]SFM48160.1 type IV pilus assembly protein PilF [Halopseudomonas yangmingensis]
MNKFTPLLLAAVLVSGCVSTGDQPRKADPQAARDAFIALGIGFLQEGETERAKKPLADALAIDPRSAQANMVLALVFQQEGEYKTAEKHYRQALSSDPNNSRLLNNYGAFLLQQQRYPEALTQFQKAAEDNMYGERSRVFENLGLTYRQMGDNENARSHFERALRLNSRQPQALLELARIEFEAQNYVPAWNYYLGFTQQAPQDASTLWLGYRMAKRFEDHSRAASYALQLRRLYPASQEAAALRDAEGQ